MGVRDRLPSGAPLAKVREVRQAQIEAKGPQLTGSSSARSYLSENPVEFDWVGALDTPTPFIGFGYAQLVVTFEALIVDYPLIDPIIEVYGSSDSITWNEVREGDGSSWGYYLHEGPFDRNKPKTKSYYLHVSGYETDFGAVKALAMGNDNFAITVQRIA